jgi:hypothetical protein
MTRRDSSSIRNTRCRYNYTARRLLPLRLRLRMIRRPLGDAERTRNPILRFLRVLCG